MSFQKHQLTTKKQGKYFYTIGPYAKPVLSIKSGDIVVIETEDAFGGKVKNENIKPSDVEKLPFVNPANGPIFIEGAKGGDTLKITIESILPRGKQPCGTTCLVMNFGGLVGTDESPILSPPLTELSRKVPVTTEGIKWNENITFPYKPFIGTIGTSPLIDSINTLTPGKHGGNMDLSDICPGNILYLPIQVDGALLYMGDCHALQGDGELSGTAIEFPTYTTIKVEILEKWTLEWPRLEGDDFIMSIGSTRPMDNATRIAYHDLIQWMVSDYGFDKLDAYFILGQVGQVHLGNMVNPNYTMGAFIEKKYLS
jgi:acetamidase/formamidase